MNARLRSRVMRRARGRCEYCRLPIACDVLPGEVDHIIAEYHGGKTVVDNLALACDRCNSHKGSNIASIDPVSGKLTPLYHPRTDVWTAHFRFEGSWVIGRTAVGRVTIRALSMNHPTRRLFRGALMGEGAFFNAAAEES